MSNPWVVLAVTIVLIAASAFFVAVEFALIAARRHRLEDAAPTSRAARAALRSSSELSVLLAGSQLGITVCTLALGAVTKPAVHHWLTPAIESIGAPLWVADTAGFVLALIVVTFLHLVVGEMAPKSWAIAHPEKSAVLLAIPMRAFMWFTRPVIVALNRLANRVLRVVGVEAVDQVATAQDTETLRALVEHSATVGTLEDGYRDHLTSALDLAALTVADVTTVVDPTGVDIADDAVQIQRRGASTGHLRLLVRDGDRVAGVVHVRDTLLAAPEACAGDVMRAVLELSPTMPVYDALARMRQCRSHIAVVVDGGTVVGVLSIDDVLTRLLATA